MPTNVNPLQMLQLIQNGANPQQLMLNFLEQQMQGTPTGNNLLNMARNNDGRGIEQFARNLCAQRGVDFDKEFSAFRKKLGI